ncbi:hypothetical protein ACQ4PT_049442 [Festuca glaucescens]
MEPLEEPFGDSGGDLESLLSRGSDELAVVRDRILGKFWEALSSDDEDSSSSRPSPCAPRYVILSSSRSSEEGKSRSSKRLEKRFQQRQAAMAWAAVTTPSMSPCSDLNAAVRKGSINAVPRWHAPVLEPSTFMLDHFDAKEWITVQRRSRKKLALRWPETVQPKAIAATPVQQAIVTPVVDQVQQDGLVAVVTAAVESVGQDLAKMSKKKDKLEDTLCFRCDETGHLAIDCTAVLCLCCDSSKHATADCHLHVMQKPVAQMYGLCNDALLFFDVPKSIGVKSKRHNGKVGRIRVAGGSLSSHQVVKELSFLVPGKHQWDITMVEDNIFKVVYPTKADCARLRKINDIKILCVNVDAIPDRTDHSYDGEGFVIRVEVEGRTPPTPFDHTMQDAQDSGDDKGNERANPSNDDLPPSDAPHNDKSSSASGLPSEQLQHGKQLVDAVQMCPIKFGSFDPRSSLSSVGCASAPGPVAKATLLPSVLQKSAGHVYDFKQKKSWGARAEEDVEESLPSPLAPCPKIASEREKNEGLSAVSTSMLQCNEAETVVAMAADLLPLFSAAADERAVSAAESDQVPISRLPGVVSDAKPGVFLGTLEVLPRQEARAACSDPVEVDILAVRGSPATSSVRAGLNNIVQQSTRTESRGQSARCGTGVFLGGRFSKDELIAFGGIPTANIRLSEHLRAHPDHDATQMERAQLRAAAKNSPAVKGWD